MLRRPDLEPDSDRPWRSRRRILLVVALIIIATLASLRLSPVGTLVGALAGSFIILFGAATGWFITHVLKIPRDGRGVHERFTSQGDEQRE